MGDAGVKESPIMGQLEKNDKSLAHARDLVSQLRSRLECVMINAPGEPPTDKPERPVTSTVRDALAEHGEKIEGLARTIQGMIDGLDV